MSLNPKPETVELNFPDNYQFDESAPERVNKSNPEGLEYFYDDSYGPLIQGLREGSSGLDLLQDLLENFKGTEGDLQGVLEGAAFRQIQAQSMMNTDAYKYLQDYESRGNEVMGQYGQTAGQIGQAGAQAQQTGMNQLASTGLGRSSAGAALAQQAIQQTGSNQAGLFNQLYQQSLSAKSAYAGQAFDAQRQVAQMALGQEVTGRAESGGGGGPGIGGYAAAGAAAGSAFGPWGTAAGALGGAAYGALS